MPLDIVNDIIIQGRGQEVYCTQAHAVVMLRYTCFFFFSPNDQKILYTVPCIAASEKPPRHQKKTESFSPYVVRKLHFHSQLT